MTMGHDATIICTNEGTRSKSICLQIPSTLEQNLAQRGNLAFGTHVGLTVPAVILSVHGTRAPTDDGAVTMISTKKSKQLEYCEALIFHPTDLTTSD